MGLSISNSAAERERVYQITQKKNRSANQSQVKSQSRNRDLIITPQFYIAASPGKERDNKEAELKQMRKSAKWKDKMGTPLETQDPLKQPELPLIKANPPPAEVIQYQSLQKKEKETLQKSKLNSKVGSKQPSIPKEEPSIAKEEPAQLPPNIPVKETKKIEVVAKQPEKGGNRIKQYFEPSPANLGVQNLTQNTSPSRPKRPLDDSSILSSASRTLNLKKTIPGIDEPQPILEQRGLDVQFENFDWDIPHPKGENELGQTKRLKPEASVVLINKFGQQQTEEEAGEKKKWKTRRELMKEIVNDRLGTTDELSLPSCNPKGFESIHNLCK